MMSTLNKSVITRPAWLTAEAIREPLWMPPHFVGAAWAVDGDRALLVDERIDAWADFCALVEAARPTIYACRCDQRTGMPIISEGRCQWNRGCRFVGELAGELCLNHYDAQTCILYPTNRIVLSR